MRLGKAASNDILRKDDIPRNNMYETPKNNSTVFPREIMMMMMMNQIHEVR